MTCTPTRAVVQNYTLGHPYDTWCTCINTETELITNFLMETLIDFQESHTVTTLQYSSSTWRTDTERRSQSSERMIFPQTLSSSFVKWSRKHPIPNWCK